MAAGARLIRAPWTTKGVLRNAGSTRRREHRLWLPKTVHAATDPIISNRSRSGSITSKVGTGESSKLDHTELLGGTILHHTIRQEQNTVNSVVSHKKWNPTGFANRQLAGQQG